MGTQWGTSPHSSPSPLSAQPIVAKRSPISATADLLFVFAWLSREPLIGFAPNSHGKRVWSLARTSLKVKVKGQGHQAYVRFMFGETSLAFSLLTYSVWICIKYANDVQLYCRWLRCRISACGAFRALRYVRQRQSVLLSHVDWLS